MPAVVVDDVLPVLTSRFLAFREEDAAQEQEQQKYADCFKLPANLLDDDTSPPPPSPMVVSPGNSRTGKDVAAQLLSPERGYGRRLSCPPRVPTAMTAIPTTPISTAALAGGVNRYRALDLFASFSSQPASEVGMWAPAASPQTACAVRGPPTGATKVVGSGSGSGSAAWLPPPAPRLQLQLPPLDPSPSPLSPYPARDPSMTKTPVSNPTLPPTRNRNPCNRRHSLPPPLPPSQPRTQRDDGPVPPMAFIVCVNDDEVSLLADNPDDDDPDFGLPHVTYNVLANVLDQM